jgi:benzoate membrane transport protein
VILTLYYRLPIVVTGNLFALIFIVSLGDDFTYSELVGAFIITGLLVLVVSVLGLTNRLSSIIPPPIVFGLLAGAIMPFVSNIFTALGELPFIVGSAVLAYLLSSRFFGNRVPAIFPAAAAGLTAVFLSGQIGSTSEVMLRPVITFIEPDFSAAAIITVAPIVLVLISLQSNLPSVIYLKSQDFQPPHRMIDLVSTVGTIFGSFFGPIAVSVSLPITSLVSGFEAGALENRYRAGLLAASSAILIGLLAGIAAVLPVILPAQLLITLAGLAMVPVLSTALKRVAQGPLYLGPMFAFAIALSDISLLGFGSFFWALVIGTATSFLLEQRQLNEQREGIT